MRLLHCLSTREFAGTERHVAGLTAALSRHHDVTLLLRRETRDPRTGGDIADCLDPGVRLIRARRAGYAATLAELLTRERFDIVHTHLGQASMRARALRPLLRRTRLIGTLHNAYRERVYGGHDALICVANWQADALPDGMPHRVIGNWAEHCGGMTRAAARERLRAAEGAFVFGAAGRLVPEKGFDDLLAAYARARSADPLVAQSVLLILGDGPERARLEAMGVEGVRFLGFQPDCRGLLRGLDAFVLPSHREPFGIVLLEAMGAGLPIMATRAGGVPDILGGSQALLVPPRDVAVLAAGLGRLRRMSPVGYDLRRFSIEACVAETCAFYREVAGVCAPAGIAAVS